MRLKRWMLRPVLALRPMLNAVRKHCLEPVELSSRRVDAPIDHQAGEMLSHALAHDSSLAMIHRKPFFTQDGRNLRGKRIKPGGKSHISAERKIVSVPCVHSIGRPCQTLQPAIRAVTAKVGQRR